MAVEFALVLILLLSLAVGVVEFGRALIQYVTLSMVSLEAALLSGSLTMVPGTNVGNGYNAIAYQSNALLGLDGQKIAISQSAPVAITSTFTRTATTTQPASSTRIDLSTPTNPAFAASGILGGLGVSLSTGFLAPNFLGDPVSVTPGFENPIPLVDCTGNPIPGCSGATCAQASCP